MTRNIAKLGDFIEPAPVVKCGDAEYPVLSMTMHEGIMLQSDRFKKSLASVDKNNYKVVEKGQLVIGFPIDEGVLYIQNVVKAGIMSPAYNVWNIKKDKINPIFLEYCLHSPQAMNFYKSNLRGSTARRRTIPSETLLNLPIPNVSFLEQENAISNITEVKTLINLANKQLDLLDQLVKSHFVEMFGNIYKEEYKYPNEKLGKIANVGSSHRVFTTEFVKKGIPFYRGTEIGLLANREDVKETYYISEEHYQRIASDETKPQIGDVLLPSICDKGQVWMVDNNKPFYYKDGRVLSIRPNLDILVPRFLEQYMKIKTIIEYPKLGSGSTFAEFKIFLLKDIDVVVPPLALQNQFADFVQQVDKAKAYIKQSLEQLETLKKKLMQDYFG